MLKIKSINIFTLTSIRQYINGRKKGKYLGINKSVLLITASTSQAHTDQEPTSKRQWTDQEKKLFLKGLVSLT